MESRATDLRHVRREISEMVKRASSRRNDADATVTRIDSAERMWVRLDGALDETPVRASTVQAAVGERVTGYVRGGGLYITGNYADKATGDERANAAYDRASEAAASATRAFEASEMARSAAASATEDARTAKDASSRAVSDAGRANVAAESAVRDAATARASAESAVADAATARDAAERAERSAEEAKESAAEAKDRAAEATNYANSALDQLGIVQDVVGVLEWANDHGTFEPTGDAEVVEGKVYFALDPDTGDYVPVVTPDASQLAGYYELSMEEAMNDFILAHLAVTQRGLWVLPSGLASGTVPGEGESQADSDARQAEMGKVLLSKDGMTVYDGWGAVVAEYGEGIDFSPLKSWHVGSDDAYILYTPAYRDTPAKLTIGGADIQIGSSMTLDEWIAARDEALDDAARTATNYIAEVADGVMVHPEGDDSNGVRITDQVEVVRDGTTMARFGAEGVRIGEAGGSRVELGSSGMEFYYGAEAEPVMSIEVGDDNASVVKMTRGVMTDSVQVGKWTIARRSNGNMKVKWVG